MVFKFKYFELSPKNPVFKKVGKVLPTTKEYIFIS